MTPNTPERREKPEPEEGAEPVPPVVWVAIVGLVVWGFAYFLLYSGSPDDVGGDMRTVAEVVEGPAAVDGAALYAGRCASCHQADGKGIPGAFPPLAGSPWVLESAEIPVRIVLGGLQGPIEVLGATYQGVMPAFGSQLGDAEIAAVLSHVRSSFGNTAGAVSEAEVKAVREAMSGRAGPWTADELKTP